MLFPSCLTQVKQSFFLQNRNTKVGKGQNRELLSPQSKMNQKISLKSLKSIKSQRSLKTISTNEEPKANQTTSLKCIAENQRNNVHIVCQNEHFGFFTDSFADTRITDRTVKVSKIQRRTLDLPVAQLPKICITYQKNDRIRNFVSPDPRANLQIVRQQQSNFLLRVPPKESHVALLKEVEQISQEIEVFSISVSPCMNNDSLQAISQVEKDQDMKSTHIGEQKLYLPLYFPSKAKSTVSMLSERSSCESILMDRQCLKIQGKISKLL